MRTSRYRKEVLDNKREEKLRGDGIINKEPVNKHPLTESSNTSSYNTNDDASFLSTLLSFFGSIF